MASSFSKAVRTTWGRTQKGVTFIRQHTFAFNVLALSSMVILAVVYITQVNTSVAKGYVLRDIEGHIRELTLQNQQLEGEARSLQSLDHVSGAVQLLGLVPAGQPVYIRGVDLP